MAQVKIDFDFDRVQRRLMDNLTGRMLQAEGYARRTYQRNVGTPYPPASRPGRFPHRRTGRLQRGINTNVNAVGRSAVRLTLTNTVPHALYLEHGTPRMAPRPHLGPTAAAVIGFIKQLFR